MQKKIVRPILGYSLLIMLNSFEHIKNDFIRIRRVFLMRYGSHKKIHKTVIPLLVSSIRFAQNAGLSLEIKNIVKDKTFFTFFKIKIVDYIVLLVTLSSIIYIFFNS